MTEIWITFHCCNRFNFDPCILAFDKETRRNFKLSRLGLQSFYYSGDLIKRGLLTGVDTLEYFVHMQRHTHTGYQLANCISWTYACSTVTLLDGTCNCRYLPRSHLTLHMAFYFCHDFSWQCIRASFQEWNTWTRMLEPNFCINPHFNGWLQIVEIYLCVVI